MSKRCAGTPLVSKKRRQRRKCEICGLREAHLTDDSIHFAVFPRDENRCWEWLRIVGNVELTHLPIEKLHQLKRVCSLHFKRRDFNKLGNRLKKHAVPSHNLPIPPLTESQLANFPQHIRKSQGSSVVLTEQLQNQENILQAFPSGSGVNSQKHIASEKPVLKHQNSKEPKKRSGENHPSKGLMIQIKTTIDSQRELGVRRQQEQIKVSSVPLSTMLLDHNYLNTKENIPPVVEHQGDKNPNKQCSESLHGEVKTVKIIKTTKVAPQELGVRPQQEQIKVSSVPVSTMLRDHNYSKYSNSKENIPPVVEDQDYKNPNKRRSESLHDEENIVKRIKTTKVASQELDPSSCNVLAKQMDNVLQSDLSVSGVKPQQEQIKLSNVSVSTMLLEHNYSKYYNPKENIPPVVDHQGAKNPNKRCSESFHDEEPPTKILKTTVASQELDMSSKIHELTQELRKTKCNLTALKKSAKLIHNLKSDVLKEIVTSALSNQNKKPKGRRWTVKNKISALSIFKRSPKTYRFLRNIIPLPSTKTLNSILRKIPFETGINGVVMDHLKAICSKVNHLDKFCTISFDEIALKPKLQYNAGSDKIEGFQEWGTESEDRSAQIADHALVFMLKGIRRNIKQPLAYYFVKGTISSEKLAVIIKDVIKAVEETGFVVLATVCDQGPTNMGALKLLKNMSRLNISDNYFVLGEKKIFIVYDVPHLFKSIRNNFLNNGEMIMCGKKAKWNHLQKVEEKNKNFLYLSKISYAHVSPKYRQKMKVKYAAQMLSCTVSAVLKLMAQAENDAELLETGEIIKELDALFDATNGPSGPDDIKKGYRQNVSMKTNHVEIWESFEKKLKTVKFQKPNGQVTKNVRCINGYLITLKSLKDIWNKVQALGFKYLNLRNLNQDSLENMFGVIRQHSPTNKNPTCSCFIAALKTNIISGMTAPHSQGSNCEKDKSKIITDFKEIIFGSPDKKDKPIQVINDQKEPAPAVLIEEDDLTFLLSIPDVEEEIEEANIFNQIDDQPLVYVSGYLAASVIKNHSCEDCQESLIINDPSNALCYEYIRLREWWEDKKSLKYPSLNLCKLVEAAVKIFNTNIVPVLHSNAICRLCVTFFMAQCDTNFIKCNIHRHEIVNKLFIRLALLFIRRQCQIINQTISQHIEALESGTKRAQQIGTSLLPS